MLAAVILWLGGVLYLLYQALRWHPVPDAAKLQAIGSAFKYVPTGRPGNEFRVGVHVSFDGYGIAKAWNVRCSASLWIATRRRGAAEPRHGHVWRSNKIRWAEKFLQRPCETSGSEWDACKSCKSHSAVGKAGPTALTMTTPLIANPPVRSQSLPMSHFPPSPIEKEASPP